jgi:hypothetical protein
MNLVFINNGTNWKFIVDDNLLIEENNYQRFFNSVYDWLYERTPSGETKKYEILLKSESFADNVTITVNKPTFNI